MSNQLTSETRVGPTPNGGVRSEIIYLRDGQRVDKSQATSAEIIEYDAAGKTIHRTYMTLRKKDQDNE